MRRFLVDTGPLVALLNPRDRHHQWARALFATIEPPAYTCEVVLAEASFLLRDSVKGQTALLRLVQAGVLQCEFRMFDEIEALATLMKRFDSVPMSLADACLVRMSEIEHDSKLATLDADFRIYRRNQRHVIPTLMPKHR